MEDISKIIQAIRFLSRNQKSIIRSLFESNSSFSIESFNQKLAILSLQDRGLIEIDGNHVSLSTLGKDVVKYWHDQLSQESPPRKSSNKWDDSRQKSLEKSNELLELYKQGLFEWKRNNYA